MDTERRLSRSRVSSGMFNLIWKKIDVDVYGNACTGRHYVQSEMKILCISACNGERLAVAIPRDLRIAAEEGDLLQEVCELLV